ncbi:MAG: alpha/beta fold hydrolase [Acidobacteria bacterium]|nr:alpha/beta fold hydrolase [Acidobacteriota bacterium]
MSDIPNSAGFELSGGKIGVLVIHGFGGSPVSVRPWAESFNNFGYTVSVPRLPGHGTNWQDLNLTTSADWFAEVEKSFAQLRSKTERVFLAGFSNGGALALRLSQIHGAEIEGLILLNPIIHDRRFFMKFLPVMHLLKPSLKSGPSDIAKPNPPVHSYRTTAMHALNSARKFWRIVERDLYLIDLPLMIGYSINDHVVDPENSDTIIDNVMSVDIREIIFEKSFHNVSLDYDSEILNDESNQFIQDVLTGELVRGSYEYDEDDDERDLIDAEFDAIVSGLSLDESAPTTYLDELASSEMTESHFERNMYAIPTRLPKFKKAQRISIIALIAGPIYIIGNLMTNFDPFGLGTWPGVLAVVGGGVGLLAQMEHREIDESDDGAIL